VAIDIDPKDGVSQIIGLPGEKVYTVRQRQDNYDRVEINADGFIRLGDGSALPATVLSSGVSKKVAAFALGGNRVVAFRSDGLVEHASNTTAGHQHLSVGVTTGAVSLGAVADVLSLGEMTEGSWSWTPGQLVFLGVNGLLTQTVPTAPSFLRVVGVAVTSTTLFISPHPAITL
jgi:hypothetical protein